ncbi:MAG: hypothetical protein IKQ99_03415 [Alphaproteobacteria bacterium]|nr:hypothetical protein [Alphaproteobacteria bacterium]
MDKIKNAITSLEQAVLKLESAVHEQKRERGVANEKIIELRLAIQRTYDRLDQAIANYRKGEE